MMQCNVLSKVQNTYPKPIYGHQEYINQIKTPEKQTRKAGGKQNKKLV